MRQLLGIFIVLFISKSAFAQSDEMTKVTPFEISITIIDNELLLQGIEGTAWIDLSFLLENGSEQVINQSGMSSIKECNSQKEQEDSFCFVLKRTVNGIALTSNHGTSWRELSFSLGNYSSQKIDHHGMIME